MEKIKILHLIKSLGRGGAEMLLPETLKIHNKEKFSFHYIYFLPWKDQMVTAIEKNGGIISCVEATNNIHIIRKIPELINYVKNNNIKLIHCHLPWAGFAGRIIHKFTNVPVIYTEHNLQERYHSITKYLNQYTYNWQSKAIGVSDDVTQSIKININPKIEVVTIPNGVNTQYFKRNADLGLGLKQSLGIPEDSIIIGNIAVFRFQKRLSEWLICMSEIISNSDNVYGILVGFGPLEKEIKEKLIDLNLENKIFLPGLQIDVKPYLSAMDVFMMTSSFEGLPVAMLEAMSMECAVVATNAGGIKEVIRNHQDGLICDVDNWQELPDMVGTLLKNKSKLNILKANSRNRVLDKFSMTRMVSELELLYTDIVQL
ncbi:glycosyltransferase [Gillisia marina]|uniref:glycosyltransferase n=1 Tax=Gillisia marina TaxID=1167637 RepID=UPI0002F5D819|nr:glycosyltransferase [Gillisia marina]